MQKVFVETACLQLWSPPPRFAKCKLHCSSSCLFSHFQVQPFDRAVYIPQPLDCTRYHKSIAGQSPASPLPKGSHLKAYWYIIEHHIGCKDPSTGSYRHGLRAVGITPSYSARNSERVTSWPALTLPKKDTLGSSPS